MGSTFYGASLSGTRRSDDRGLVTRPAPTKGPLTEHTAFEDALRKGLGRAILHVQKHGAAGLEQTILHACLTDLRYDPMFEDVRSPYLYDLLHATGAPGDYLEPILEALAGNDEDNAYQLCGLAMRFARDGSDEARKALYARVERNAGTEDISGWDEVIEFDGIEGFQHVARHHAWLLDSEGIWRASSRLEDLEQRTGPERTWAELRALDDPAVGALLNAIQGYREQRDPRPEWKKPDVGDFRSMYLHLSDPARAGRHAYLWRWGKYTSPDQLELAAKALLAETNVQRVRALLDVFHWRRFPLDHTPLIDMARSDDIEIAFRTALALQHIADPSVRELGLELLGVEGTRYRGVWLLTTNYQETDQGLLAEVCAAAPTDEDLAHRLGLAALEFEEAHPGPGSTSALLSVYEWTPCAGCRESCVRHLVKHNALTEAIREECLWDCEEETRALARGEAGPGE
jgi:hypothetical protein